MLALRAHNRRMGLPWPETELRSARLVIDDDRPGVRLVLEFAAANGAAPDIHTFDDAALISALILFCRDRRIPLASKATKTLRCSGGLLNLCTVFNPCGNDIPAELNAA